MGAFLDRPKTEKENEKGSGNGLRFGLSSMQGWRVEMEDAHSAVIGLPFGLKDWSFFAVFDGHAGSKVAKYCARYLLEEVTSNSDFTGKETPPPTVSPTEENVKSGIRTGFLKIDEKMRTVMQNDKDDKSGSTAIAVMISPTHYFFANCGDSRAVFFRDGEICYKTLDHKPANPDEKRRITNAGGTVMIQRVNGSLAVSRALGDYEYKNVVGKDPIEQLVSPEPEIGMVERSEKDEFIVLACDGVWDVMSNEELCQFVKSRLQLTDNLEDVCNQVVETCLNKGSRDNMSIVLVTLQNAPKISQEAIEKEAKLDEILETKTKEILESYGDQTGVDMVMHVLASSEIEGLPPGGGISAKKSKVEEIVNRLNPDSKKDKDEETDEPW